MRYLFPIALLAMVGCVDPAAQPAPEPRPIEVRELPSLESVKYLLYGCQKFCGSDITVHNEEALIAMGDRAFPAYEVILADPNSDLIHIRQACRMIARVQIDRRRFVPLAIRRATERDAFVSFEALSNKATGNRPHLWRVREGATVFEMVKECVETLTYYRESVRGNAIFLLGAIADERDAAVLIPLLSDESEWLRCASANALAKIGGKSELDALDGCLIPGGPRRNSNELKHFKERRDELEARLKVSPVPKHLMN